MGLRAKLIIAFGALAIAIAAVAYRVTRPPEIYVFAGVEGPNTPTIVPPPVETPWQKYRGGSKSRLAILLTDEHAPWLGLAHGLKSIGVPFTITTDYAEAVTHRVVLVYPRISGLLSAEALKALAALPRDGGTLIGVNVLGGGLEEVFGFSTAEPSRQHFELRFGAKAAQRFGFIDPREQVLSLGNRAKTALAVVGTYGYLGADQYALARYEDGQAAITERSIGAGKAYAVGIDLGSYILQGYNNREEAVGRSYDNGFEPSIDVLLRLLRSIYRAGESDAVTLGTVPFDRALSVVLSHDIDYTKSLPNSVAYAEFEKSQGVRATYFMQTKYLRDFNDDVILNDDTVPYLRRLAAMGMEIGSHTVAHSRVFKYFPLGTGKERYPDYRPFVRDRDTAVGGTILGEVRVSKFLVETLGGYAPVLSFRPGELSNPFALPQVLEAAGYRYSSSVTANSSLTHLPFQLNYNRENTAETPIYEFPLTIEDEELPPMGQRLPQALDLAHKVARYGGSVVVLIHPDILGHKLDFERGFVTALKPEAWFGTIGEFGAWWAARDAVTIEVADSGDDRTVTLMLPQHIAGLGLSVPSGWTYRASEPVDLKLAVGESGVLIAEAQGTVTLHFTAAAAR
ncbi:MAG TPA: polysaccharide deacetylase family protein [Stellaceae bacterium]|nr:polysaccharide deacetylase family protein [Stellaceae bacterium]